MTPRLAFEHAKSQPAVWSRTSPVVSSSRPASHYTILAIDDDALLLELMTVLLSDAGFTVLTATSGTQGLALLRQANNDVQVILLDYQMPVCNGAQVLPAVRQLAPAASVLGVSGTAQAELPPEFRDGVDRLLSKPFTGDDLVAAVSALLPAESAATNHEDERRSIFESARHPVATAAANGDT